MDISPHIRATLTSLPKKPGVYLFKDEKKQVLYVGKANILHHRVRNYFQKGRMREPSKESMITHITSIETIVTPSETDALLLEATLIKEYQPPYNIILKDDKYFLYIRVSTSDDFPTVDLVRSITKKSDLYFGPFTSSHAVRETVKTLKRIFKFRTCTPHQGTPCFDYTIGRCLGPCIDAISKTEYHEMIVDLTRFLKGKDEEVLSRLTTRMYDASQKKKFEYAGTMRDRIMAIKKIARKQTVIAQHPLAFDVLGVAKEKRTAAVAILQIRSGKLLNKQTVILSNKPNENERDILEAFISQYYSRTPEHPKDIYAELVPSDTRLLEKTFFLRVHHPTRGAKATLTHTAHHNATSALKNYFASFEKDADVTHNILRNIQKIFKLPTLPHRIESFDVANIQGKHGVGSMVVFLDGKSAQKLYKRFTIKTVSRIDDPAMMAEIFSRRLAHLTSNNDEWQRPDLIIIDGGKGQLSGLKKLPLLQKNRLALFALAKGGHARPTEQNIRERFYSLSGKIYTLPPTSPELYLLERIRDEAHRFAITFYRKKHGTTTTTSRLDLIPGVGSKRRTNLLRHFGSMERIQNASHKEIALVIGQKMAHSIKKYLSKKNN